MPHLSPGASAFALFMGGQFSGVCQQNLELFFGRLKDGALGICVQLLTAKKL